MKKLKISTYLLMILLVVSCDKDNTSPAGETGKLTLNIGLTIEEQDVRSDGLKAARALEDFKVSIFQSDGSLYMVYDTLSKVPDTIEMDPGIYYVEVHSDNDFPAEFENPFYFGLSGLFTINSNTHEAVQVTCSLANTSVSVHYSENTLNSFFDCSTTVSTAAGSLIFTRDETRHGHFRTMPLDIRVELFYYEPDGTPANRTINGNIADPLPNRHYEIRVNSMIENGTGGFQVMLDDTEIPVEIYELNEEPQVINPPAVSFGDLLITEIMPDPSSLSDTEGEWFEIYNNSDHIINLANLVLNRDDTNNHTISDSIELQPGDFYVMVRTSTATDASNTYVYGSAISLPNTGGVLSILNEDSGDGPGELIFSLDYSVSGFPLAAGASLSLDPSHFNATDAVMALYWCSAVSLYNTGDSGTPGSINDSCQ